MEEKQCFFCGRTGESESIRFMIQGPEGRFICNDCIWVVSIAANQTMLEKNGLLMKKDPTDETDGEFYEEEEEYDPYFDEEDYSSYDVPVDEVIEATKTLLTPKEITEMFNRNVIGQDAAKKVLAVGVYNHSKMLRDVTGRIKKSNILMIGPSGSGKTLLAQCLAKVLHVPFTIADATSLTEAGYVGDDVENILLRLLMAADGDVDWAEKGIIYIDEIDKIARKGENPSITRDVSGEGVQHALLKIIEGAEVSVPVAGGRKHPMGQNVMINTKNILFICGGAFDGLNNLKPENRRPIGFGAVAENEEQDVFASDITPDLLVRYGMTPELVGRLPVIVSLDNLSEDDLIRILTEPENALVKEYKALFEADGMELEFEDDALREIAKVALKRNTGARGLRAVMEEIMMDIMYTAPSNGHGKYTITKETVFTKVPKFRAA